MQGLKMADKCDTLKRLKESGDLNVSARRGMYEREAQGSVKPPPPARPRVKKEHFSNREEHKEKDDDACKNGSDTVIMDIGKGLGEPGKDKGNEGKGKTTGQKEKGKEEGAVKFTKGKVCDNGQTVGGIGNAGEKTEDKAAEDTGNDLSNLREYDKGRSDGTEMMGAKGLRQTYAKHKTKGDHTKVNGSTHCSELGIGTTENRENIEEKRSTGVGDKVRNTKEVERDKQGDKREVVEDDDDYEEIENIDRKEKPVKGMGRGEQEKESGGAGKDDVDEIRGGNRSVEQVRRTAGDDDAYARAVSRRMSSEDGRRNGCLQSSELEAMTQTQQRPGMSHKNQPFIVETNRGHSHQAAAGSRESTSSNPDEPVDYIAPTYITTNWKAKPITKGGDVKMREDPKHRSERPTTSFFKQLSIDMDAMISKDESSFENVSIKNRPTVIADLYSALCTGEWLNAKQEMDNKMTLHEDDKLKFLCFVLEISLETAKYVKHDLDAKVKDFLVPLLSQPFQALCCQGNSSLRQARADGELSDQIKTSVSDFLRIHVQEVEVGPLKERVTIQLKERVGGQLPALKDLAVLSPENCDIHEYIQACSHLAWMMVIQRPQMTFQLEGIGGRFKTATQEPHWGSSDPTHPKSIVAFYVHPAIYHAEKLMGKGKVILVEK